MYQCRAVNLKINELAQGIYRGPVMLPDKSRSTSQLGRKFRSQTMGITYVPVEIYDQHPYAQEVPPLVPLFSILSNVEHHSRILNKISSVSKKETIYIYIKITMTIFVNLQFQFKFQF